HHQSRHPGCPHARPARGDDVAAQGRRPLAHQQGRLPTAHLLTGPPMTRESALLHTPAIRKARREAARLATALAAHLRLALLATVALTVAAVTAGTAALFALAALVRGLE